MKLIKTWEERAKESTEEVNDMPPGKQLYMEREITDLRARAQEANEMEALLRDITSKFDLNQELTTRLFYYIERY